MSFKRLLTAGLAVALLLSGCSSKRVVGTVGERSVVNADVDKRMALVKLFSPDLDLTKVPRADVVDQLLEENMLLAEAEKQGITVSADKVDAAYQEVEASLIGQFGDKAKLEAAFKKEGLAAQDLKAVVANNLTLQQLYTKVTGDIQVTETEVEKYYTEHQAEFQVPEQVKASHILVAEEKLAEEIRERLLEGEDFAELAKEYSIDPGSRESGGELGYFPPGQMVAEFDKAAFSTPVGELSPVVKTTFGYHIIKVEDKKPARTLTLDEVREYLAAQLEGQKKDEKFQAFVDDLRAKVKPENKLAKDAAVGK